MSPEEAASRGIRRVARPPQGLLTRSHVHGTVRTPSLVHIPAGTSLPCRSPAFPLLPPCPSLPLALPSAVPSTPLPQCFPFPSSQNPLPSLSLAIQPCLIPLSLHVPYVPVSFPLPSSAKPNCSSLCLPLPTLSPPHSPALYLTEQHLVVELGSCAQWVVSDRQRCRGVAARGLKLRVERELAPPRGACTEW